MVALCVVLLFLGVLRFDFIPQYQQRKKGDSGGDEKKTGFWLYTLLLLASFGVLMLMAFGAKLDLSWIFGL